MSINIKFMQMTVTQPILDSFDIATVNNLTLFKC